MQQLTELLLAETFRMRPKLNPNYPSTGVLILVLCSSLLLLASGLPGLFVVREAVAAGRVYSLAALYGSSPTISLTQSPAEYWAHIVIYMSGCALAIGLGVFVPITTTKAYVRKLERQRKERGPK